MPPSQQQQQHIRSLSDVNANANANANANPFDQFGMNIHNTNTTTTTNTIMNAAPSLPNLSSGVVLGVEQLERQQIQMDHAHAANNTSTNTTRPFMAAVVVPSSKSVIESSVSSPTMPGPVLRASSEPPRNSSSSSRKNPFDEPSIAAASVPNQEISNPKAASATSEAKYGMNAVNAFSKMFTPLRTRVSEFNLAKIADADEGTNVTADMMSSNTTTSVTVLSLSNGNNTANNLEDRRDDNNSDDWPIQVQLKSLICGYLYKKTRNGVWQRRFFETDGQCLTYYKSKKRTKKLAELDLYKVGSIEIDVSEPVGATFIIQVKNRPYYLRAENKECAEDWVINLNRVREARFGIGGMKLTTSTTTKGKMLPDLISSTTAGQREGSVGASAAAANPSLPVGFVVSSNRQRSHALRQDGHDGGQPGDAWAVDSMEYDVHGNSIRYEYNKTGDGAAATASQQLNDDSEGSNEDFAKWKKRGTRLRMIQYRLVRWARNINLGICKGDDRENVIEPTNARPTDTSVGGDTSVVGSEVSGMSHGHAQGQGSHADETANTREMERNERNTRSFKVDVKAMIKVAARSPKRSNIEPGPTCVADRNDAPTPTFHMA